jgi:hypothetical protein
MSGDFRESGYRRSEQDQNDYGRRDRTDPTDPHFPNAGLHEQKAANRPNREKYKYSYGAKDCGSCESKLTDQKEHERKNAEAAEQSECEPLDGRKRWRQEVWDPEACPKCGHCKNGNRKYSA